MCISQRHSWHFFLFSSLLICSSLSAQSQTVRHLPEHSVDASTYENIHVEQLDDDPLTTTYLIWVKQHVKEHYHTEHTEVVFVLDGEGNMQLNDEWKKVSKGDYIFIPKGTRHSVEVTSKHPMKVISIQTPRFDGNDRIFVSQE